MKLIISFSFLLTIIVAEHQSQIVENIGGGSCGVDIQKVEKTFIMLKPDCLKRGLVGESIKRFEVCQGCKLLALKTILPNETQVLSHYDEMKDEIWFTEMVEFMTSGLVIPMVWEGVNMPAVGRQIVYSIREDNPSQREVEGHLLNIVHGSDTEDDAIREMKIWFTEQELAVVFKEDKDSIPNAHKFWPTQQTCPSKLSHNNKSKQDQL